MALPAIPPGEHLQQELETLAMSAAAFARKIDVPPNRIMQILKGERDITADTAMRLGHFFGTSAQFWMNLQSIYDLRLAQDRNGSAIKALPDPKARPQIRITLAGVNGDHCKHDDYV
jgi:addiction module HigA family antidote